MQEAKRRKALEQENVRLKKLLAVALLEQEVTCVMCYEKSGRRTGSSRDGALDEQPGSCRNATPCG